MYVLEKDESAQISAYITTPGYQRIVLSGYLREMRADGAYIAPLLPQLFYGADGKQLQTWQQYLPNTGNQVILSRSGGQPMLPREELYWRKVETKTERKTQTQPLATNYAEPNYTAPILLLGGTLIAVIAYVMLKKK